MQLLVSAVVFAFLVSCVTSTPVQSCTGGPHERSNDYTIGTCERPPCKLKRKSTINLELKFKPDTDLPSLKNDVHAKIIGVPFPFIGVDGTSACGQIYLPDGTKASCPLKAGQDYVYKNSFEILEIYPKLKVNVHWALLGPNNKNVVCFNVPAKITS